MCGQRMKHILSDASTHPANETVIDCGGRPILGRQIAPPAASLQHMHNPADHTAVMSPLLTLNIGWQKRRNVLPLFVRKPIQVRPHFTLPESERVNQ